MIPSFQRAAAPAVLGALSLLVAACSTLQGEQAEPKAPFLSAEAPVPQDQEVPEHAEEAPDVQDAEGEVPLSIAESEPPEVSAPAVELDAIVVSVTREEKPRTVLSVSFGSDGAITFVLSFPPVKDGSLVFTPSGANAPITWTCSSGNIPAEFLPAVCRGR